MYFLRLGESRIEESGFDSLPGKIKNHSREGFEPTCFSNHGFAFPALDHVPGAVQRVNAVVLDWDVAFARKKIKILMICGELAYSRLDRYNFLRPTLLR